MINKGADIGASSSEQSTNTKSNINVNTNSGESKDGKEVGDDVSKVAKDKDVDLKEDVEISKLEIKDVDEKLSD